MLSCIEGNGCAIYTSRFVVFADANNTGELTKYCCSCVTEIIDKKKVLALDSDRIKARRLTVEATLLAEIITASAERTRS